MSRSVRRWLAVTSTLAGVVLLACMWGRFVDRMIFQPTPGAELRPEQLGIPARDVYFRSEDGVRIHAFFLPTVGATRAILYMHGNAGNASHRLPIAAALARLGSHVLLLDYRGYGLSEGTPNEAGVYADARAGLAYLTQEIGIPEKRVVLFGSSLGGAVAVDLAQGRGLGGVILESTFASVAAVAARAFGGGLARLAGNRFDSLQKIPQLRAPLLVFHGDRDEIVDFSQGRELFEAAPEPKQFETIRGAGHNDIVDVGGPAYFERIRRFLDEVAPG